MTDLFLVNPDTNMNVFWVCQYLLPKCDCPAFGDKNVKTAMNERMN